jgi:hypothetical protein
VQTGFFRFHAKHFYETDAGSHDAMVGKVVQGDAVSDIARLFNPETKKWRKFIRF